MAIYGIATSSYASGLTRHHTDPGDLNGHLRDCDEAELPLLKGSVKVSRRPEWPSTGLRLLSVLLKQGQVCAPET